MLNSLIRQDFLASLLDRTSGISRWYVGKCTQREIRSQAATMGFNEASPHEPSGRVIGEWEVNSLVEKFKEILFGTLLRLTGTSYYGDPGLVIYELSLPLRQGFLNSWRVWTITSFLFLSSSLFAFLTLLFGRPYFVTLIDVNKGRLIFLGNDEDGSNKLFFFLFGCRVLIINVYWTQVEQNWVGLMDDRSNDQGLTGACRSVE